jgi:serine/threonine protein kinase
MLFFLEKGFGRFLTKVYFHRCGEYIVLISPTRNRLKKLGKIAAALNTLRKKNLKKFDNCKQKNTAKSISRMTLDKQIAEGEGTGVFQSIFQSEDVAIKKAISLERIKEAKNEFLILSSLPPHPNIIKPLANEENDGFNIVFPLFEYDLYTLLKTRELSPNEQRNIVRQVAKALSHLHENKIVHRDVKIENILISKDRVVLADLGLAHSVDAIPPGNRGTVEYVAPECITTTDPSLLDFQKVCRFLYKSRSIVLPWES